MPSLRHSTLLAIVAAAAIGLSLDGPGSPVSIARAQTAPMPSPTSEGSVLAGTITDAATGEPLPYVSIVAVGRGQNVRRGASSREDGTFTIADLPPGAYDVEISCIGYVSAVRTIDVPSPDPTPGTADARATITLDAALDFEAIPLEGVDVTGDRFARDEEVQTGFVVLEADELAELPAVGEADPIRSLQLLPGIQAASDISSGLYVRGGGPDQTLVLLDQVPIYNPTHAFGFFSTFNADGIDKVTLYKGAYPAQYGGRLGAVLDVTNRAGSREKTKAKFGISTIAARGTVDGPIGKNATYLVSARRTYLEPILSALRNEDNQIPEYYFYDLNGKLVLNAEDRRSRWVFSSYGGRDNLYFDLDTDSFLDIGWGNRMFTAGYERFLGENALAEVYVAASEYESVTDVKIFTTPFSFENRLRDYNVRADISWEPTARHRLSGGLASSIYDFKFQQVFNEEKQVDFDTQPYDVSLFFQDEWTPNEYSTVRGGARLRYFSAGNVFLFEPRISLSRQVSDKVRLKWGGGVYNQYLQLVTTEGFSAGDFYLPIDESAKPGRSYQTVTGLDWEISRKYQVSFETYYTGLNDLVLFDNNVNGDGSDTDAESVFLTGGKGFATGVEVFAQRRVGPLTGWVGYTLGWTRRTFDELNQGKSFPPKYDRRHDLSVVGRLERGKWTYTANFLSATGQAYTPASARWGIRNPTTGVIDPGLILPAERNSERLLPYHRLDVSVMRDFSLFGTPATWVFQVFNLYSRRNEWFIQYSNQTDEQIEPEIIKMLPIIPSLGVTFEF